MVSLLVLMLVVVACGIGAVIATEDEEALEFALSALVAAAIVAFLLWFVACGPTPDYLPQYGSDPRDIPYQMKD